MNHGDLRLTVQMLLQELDAPDLMLASTWFLFKFSIQNTCRFINLSVVEYNTKVYDNIDVEGIDNSFQEMEILLIIEFKD